jgi:tRNA A-37 threonylcarbamoyl transferase component Bud32
MNMVSYESIPKRKPLDNLRLTTDPKDELSKTLGDQFRIDEKLGAGGMSIVYKCTDLVVQRKVAVKILQPTLAAQDKWLLRFQQEAKATGRLSHPNIVRVHHFNANGDAPFIVMDCIEGVPLDDVLAMGGAMDVHRAMHIMMQVADALIHAHGRGVTHRDLKPANIMLVTEEGEEDRVKILDFGIAKICEPEDNVKLTQTGEIFGSPLYMSPEQCLGQASDWRADQYSFACVLFECLTGCPPFTGDNPMLALMKQINDTPPTLQDASLGKSFPPGLDEVIQKMLCKDPNQRYGSMTEVKQALVDACSGRLPVTKRPAPSPAAAEADFLTRLSSRKLFLLLASAVMFIVALVGLYEYFMLVPSDADKPLPAVKLHEITEIADDDMGDPAVEKFLDSAHKYEQTFDSEAHNFKKITDKGLKIVVDKMPNLNSLILQRCGDFTNEGLAYLCNARLQALDVSDTPVADEGAAIIAKMKYLRDLKMHNTAITNEGVKALEKLPLILLDISSSNRLDDDALAYAGQMKTLHSLSFSLDSKVEHGLGHLVGLSKLEALDVGGTGVTDSDLEPLLQLKNLKKLLVGQTDVTDAGVERVIARMEGLRYISLCRTSITKKSLDALAKLTSLRELHIEGCKGLSKEDIKEFHDKVPNCSVVTKVAPVKPKGYY